MNVISELLGESPGVVAVRAQLERLLQRHAGARALPPILIQGETGTGKGLLASAIHRAGARAAAPFVDVNCAAIPETLLEAEMFGFERGAFTDAKQAKPGLFQAAHGGTIFLDEIGLLPEGVQGKLLKVIEERTLRRLGSTRSEPVDVWIITASNEDLVSAIRQRRFREDLYHRLAVLTLHLPPLRERGEDVVRLADHFLARACAEYDLPSKTLHAKARAALRAYQWSGNVRELSNVMERAALLSEGPVVEAEILGLPESVSAKRVAPLHGESSVPLEQAMGDLERQHLLDALADTGWNISRAAAQLGVSRNTLRYRIAKHDLRRDARGPGARRAAPRSTRALSTPPVSSTPTVLASEVPTVPTRWEPRRIAFLRASLVVPVEADPRTYASRAVEAFVQKIESFGGRVEDAGPTGVVAAFGVELVEDAARRAAHTAMAIQKAAERAARDAHRDTAVRLAIHVAQVLVGQGNGAIQLDLDGKRQAWTALEVLLSEAQPGQIIADEGATAFLTRHFGLVLMAPGPAGGGRTYRLVASEVARHSQAPRVAPFVGRHQEIDLLRNRLGAAMRGHAQVVGVVGEAGIGKSRLLAEFREGLRELGVTYREGRCRSYASDVPYLPLLDILRVNFRIAELDGSDVIAEKVRSGLEHVEMDPAEWAPYFLHLFGIPEGTGRLVALTPGAVKAHTFEALRQLVLTGSRRRPIVFVVEDLQWIDSVSEECLVTMMESAAGTSGMLVVTYRPGYRTPWMDRSYFTQIALPPLSHGDSLSIMRTLLSEDDIPDGLAAVILDKTEGNPFFLEELCRAVHETGALRLPATVPDTIQEVIQARIWRLPVELKDLLQTASVLGREVPMALLRAIAGPAETLDPSLRELTRLEFLSKQSGDADPMYGFTHTLTHEVAYESLSLVRRQALHAAAGEALEKAYTNRLEEVTDRLAYHYSRTERVDKALFYLTRLAERAARGHAHAEAVRILDEALGHCDWLPAGNGDRVQLDLVLRQASSLVYLGSFQAIVDLLLRHRETLERLQDATLGGHYHFLMSRSCLFLGDDERASWHATMGLVEATRSGDDAMRGKIHYVLAQRGALSGRPTEGLEHGREATALLEHTGESWWVGPAHWVVGLSHALRGEFEPALAAEAKAAAIGESVGDPQLRSSSAWATGIIYAATGDHDTGVVACRRALEHSPDPLDTAIALGWLGYAYVEKGDPGEAIEPLEQSIQQLSQFHFAQLQGLFTVMLAEAIRTIGDPDRALELARQGLDVTSRTHWPFGVGWAQRILARIAQDRDDFREAETRLGEALRAFASMEGRCEVARVHLELGTLARARGAPLTVVEHHLHEALRGFRELALPRYIERVERFAAELDMPLETGH
jgi:DNA-binding NtrC family response regulator/tetratricopeptide (TPR) repeat protein